MTPFRLIAVTPTSSRKAPAFCSTREHGSGLLWVDCHSYPRSERGERLRDLRHGQPREPHITLGDLGRALAISPALVSGLELGSLTLESAAEWDRIENVVRALRAARVEAR